MVFHTTPCTPAAADRKDLVGCVRGDGLGFEEASLQPPEMLAAHIVDDARAPPAIEARSARAATAGRGRAQRRAARGRRLAAFLAEVT